MVNILAANICHDIAGNRIGQVVGERVDRSTRAQVQDLQQRHAAEAGPAQAVGDDHPMGAE